MMRPTCVSLALVTSLALGCSKKPDGPLQPSPIPPRTQSIIGCYSANASMSQLGCGAVQSLGSPAEDAVFSSEVQVQGSFWGGVPALVSVFDECTPQQKNAYASRDRSIRFGLHLYRDLISRHPAGLPVAGVLAHEWGHQVEFVLGIVPTSTKAFELEADAFGGYYMGLAKQFAWASIFSYFESVSSSGDYNFNSPGHHGTPQERLAAARLGFDTAINVSLSGRLLTYVELHSLFASVIPRAVVAKDANVAGVELLSRSQLEEIAQIAAGQTSGADGRVTTTGPRPLHELFPRAPLGR